jgi:hypothetical protein
MSPSPPRRWSSQPSTAGVQLGGLRGPYHLAPRQNPTTTQRVMNRRPSSPRVPPPGVSPPRVSPPRVSPPRVSPPRVSPPRANATPASSSASSPTNARVGSPGVHSYRSNSPTDRSLTLARLHVRLDDLRIAVIQLNANSRQRQGPESNVTNLITTSKHRQQKRTSPTRRRHPHPSNTPSNTSRGKPAGFLAACRLPNCRTANETTPTLPRTRRPKFQRWVPAGWKDGIYASPHWAGT